MGDSFSRTAARSPLVEARFDDPAIAMHPYIHDKVVRYGREVFMVFWADLDGARRNLGLGMYGDILIMRTSRRDPTRVVQMHRGDARICRMLIKR
jgi:hypothetical protein